MANFPRSLGDDQLVPAGASAVASTADVSETAGLRVQVLGSVRAWLGEREVELGPPLRRCLFSVLAMQPGRAVPLAEVITALWGVAAPATAAGSVHTYVAGLRRALEPDPERRQRAGWLRSEESGYRLILDAGQVDAHRFEELRREGKRLTALGMLAEANAELAESAQLWQGVPFHGVP